MKTRRVWFMSLMCSLCVSANAQTSSAGVPTGRALRDALRRSLRGRSSLAAYYTFEDLKAEGLKFMPGKAEGKLAFTTGRWPEQRAARLDRGWLQGPPADAGDKGLTVACWFRCNGMGGLTHFRGRRAYYNGGIAAMGTGYYDGWRIIVSPRYRSISFNIGRPKGGAASVACSRVVRMGRWHHLAVVWDRRHMQIYLDGNLRAEAPYDGPYTPGRKRLPLRIGEIGYGVGTIKLDVADLAVFREPFPAALIARMANPLAPQADAVIARLLAGDRAAKSTRGSLAERERRARAEYEKVLALDVSDQPYVLTNYRCIARLRIAESFRREGRFDDARRVLRELAGDESAPLHYRARAMARIGDTFRDQRRYTDARAAYERMRKFFVGKHENWRVEAIERLEDVAGLKDGEPFRDARQRRIDRISHPARAFYVAPDGDDANPGTKARPFRTLERARDAVRVLKKQTALPKGGVVVWLRGGEYRRRKSFELTAADSGEFDAPVVYRAWSGEKVVVSGGVEVRGFRPATPADAPNRLPKEARPHVVVADLKALGITDFGSIQPRGFGLKPVPAHLELFFNGEPMRLARWPNPVGQVAKDFVTIAGFDDGLSRILKGSRSAWATGSATAAPGPNAGSRSLTCGSSATGRAGTPDAT